MPLPFCCSSSRANFAKTASALSHCPAFKRKSINKLRDAYAGKTACLDAEAIQYDISTKRA